MQKCFTYAVQQNKKDAMGLREAFAATVPHMYGQHHGCNARWCGYLKDPSSYKHKGLPYRKDLSDEDTRKQLTQLFQVYADNAAKLASGGSLQVNEGVNNIVTSKQPKSRSYRSSPFFNFRVGAAVCQKNIGYSYVSEVCKESGLSPSLSSQRYASRLDRKRKRDAERKSTPEFKRRRLFLKESRSTKQASAEVWEGELYSSGSGMVAASSNHGSRLGIEHDREINAPPVPKLSKVSSDQNTPLVIFDVETTTIGPHSHIVQLAARSEEAEFSQFVLPATQIDTQASKVTGLTVTGTGNNRKLLKDGSLCPQSHWPKLAKTLLHGCGKK